MQYRRMLLYVVQNIIPLTRKQKLFKYIKENMSYVTFNENTALLNHNFTKVCEMYIVVRDT